MGFGRRRFFAWTGWRARRALRTAQLLDEVVDSQLPLLPALPEARRRRSADYLAELVMLSQAYRHYAAGWIDRKELERRGQGVLGRLTTLRKQPSAAQVIDRD
ncbi:hypothetical protein GCM10010174_32380 [Kutzneria viridogrisea]|uniref:Uncharacterized protein n=2 Tax=Kutzneria TaxID=43356 RepID=W5VXX4_9PSEU|nr:hypothetical protein [Kutzneria albida]AHH93417.1 hypothetical protein KALB_40 [Kutzneria albida DSM 43870]MBA8929198.1 hypothetical protein [Kutzneria viridogrisea]